MLETRGTRILLIGGEVGFPNGTGAASRLRAFAHGLHDAGADVKVMLLLVVRPGDWSDVNTETRGRWRGIPFEYMTGQARGQRGWLRRRLLELRAMWRTHLAIREAARGSRSTAVVFSGSKLRWIVPVVLGCRLARVPIVHTRCEFPFVYERDVGWPRRALHRWYVDNVFRAFDGIVVITTYLEDYIRPRTRSGTWLMRIPILVDVGDYEDAAEATPGLVGYAATLDRREEIAALVHGVASVAKSHPTARVRVMGPGSPQDIAFLHETANSSGADSLVDAVGPVAADDMPTALCSCAALALPRAEGVFSRAGMPTKLGEYLATGRPVVVSATGDIPRYLDDGVSAFLVPPGDPEAFGLALERALFDPAAAAIGRAGQAVARSQFHATTQMRRLLGAIERNRDEVAAAQPSPRHDPEHEERRPS